MSEFSEDSRVKFPALIHMVGMGFEYVSSNNSAKPQDQQEPYDPMTNILVDKFNIISQGYDFTNLNAHSRLKFKSCYGRSLTDISYCSFNAKYC